MEQVDPRALVHDFMNAAASYHHSSWMPATLSALRDEQPPRSPLAMRLYERWLLAQAGAGTETRVSLASPLSRVALLPPAVLQQAVQVLGLLALGSRLRHVLEREQVSWLQGLFSREVLQQALPLAEHFTPVVSVADALARPVDELRLLLQRCGFRGLCMALPHLEPAYKARLSLKLPRAVSQPQAGGAGARPWVLATDPKATQTHLLTLVNRLDSSWDSLF